MTKIEFLDALREKLYGLPNEDIEKSLDYYSEIIDDRIEDGMTEYEAVEALGSAQKIASQILMDTPMPKLVKTKVKPRRALKTWEVVLLILGSPIWASLLLAVLCVVLAIYIVLWAVIVSLYSAVLSLALGGIGAIFTSVIFMCMGNLSQSALLLGSGFICSGLTVLSFLGCNQITKGVVILSKNILRLIKSCFIRKGNTQ